MDKAYQCVSYIVKQARKLSCNIDRAVRNKRKFHEAEVVVTSVKKTNIERIKDEIAESEKLLEAAFNHENVQILVGQYQQAIEYYSALGDEQFAIYLKKMQDLIRKEDELLTTTKK